MDLLALTKAKIGLTSNVRDELIKFLNAAVVEELKMLYGVEYIENVETPDLVMLDLIADLSRWRYEHKGQDGMPRHLQYRLHNLLIERRKQSV